jgi:hypothetical protein
VDLDVIGDCTFTGCVLPAAARGFGADSPWGLSKVIRTY